MVEWQDVGRQHPGARRCGQGTVYQDDAVAGTVCLVAAFGPPMRASLRTLFRYGAIQLSRKPGGT